jgi:hypothetical protein
MRGKASGPKTDRSYSRDFDDPFFTADFVALLTVLKRFRQILGWSRERASREADEPEQAGGQ